MKINVIEDGNVTEREMTDEEIADIYKEDNNAKNKKDL